MTDLTVDLAGLGVVQLKAECERRYGAMVVGSLQLMAEWGETLIALQAKVGWGKWEKWFEETFELTAASARRYMKIAEEWPELRPEFERNPRLSARGAFKLLAGLNTKPIQPASNTPGLLGSLEAIAPGFSRSVTKRDNPNQLSSPWEDYQQFASVVFYNGHVIAYNDEVWGKMPSGLPKTISGAVPAKPLLHLLRKLADDTSIDIEVDQDSMVLKGKGFNATFPLEKEIVLPLTIDDGVKWKPLPDDFNDAVAIVVTCAGKDESRFSLTCVHLHPKYLEACDNYQLTRHKLRLPISRQCIVKAEGLRHLATWPMSEIGETKDWVHFRNASGLILSCRRYYDEYPDLSGLLVFQGGNALTFPEGLCAAVDKASIFSSKRPEDDKLKVVLRKGRMKIVGVYDLGRFSQTFQTTYDGPDLTFSIAPDLLRAIARRYPVVEITTDRLKVDGGTFTYVASLGKWFE